MTERLDFDFSLSFIGEGNGNPLQYSWLENPRDGESLVGCRLWGRTESDMTEATQQQQQQQIYFRLFQYLWDREGCSVQLLSCMWVIC